MVVPVSMMACHSPPASEVTPRPDPLGSALDAYYAQDYERAIADLEALTRAEPEDPVAMGWLTEALFRGGEADRAREAAERTLALDPCESAALRILGRLDEPRLFGLPGEADDAIGHLREAVRCDPADGSAWLSLWMLGLTHGRPDLVDEAMGRVMELGFIPPSIMAFGRWLLETSPSNGILFTNGDWDYFPAAAVQRAEGVRPDVQIVLVPGLHSVTYAWGLVNEEGLPPPNAAARTKIQASVDSLQVPPWQQLFIGSWVDAVASGALTRPLIVPFTVPRDDFEGASTVLRPAGPGRVVSPAGTDSVSFADLRRGTERVPAHAFRGPTAVPSDRSPIRHAHAPPATTVVAVIAERAGLASDPSVREWAVAALESFVEAGSLAPDDPNETLRAIADLRVGALGGDWVRVSTARGGAYWTYLDTESVEDLGNGRYRVWFLRRYADVREAADGTRRDEARWLSEVECTEMRRRTVARVWYLDGEVVSPLTDVEDADWREATPGSVGEAMLERVCD